MVLSPTKRWGSLGEVLSGWGRPGSVLWVVVDGLHLKINRKQMLVSSC